MNIEFYSAHLKTLKDLQDIAEKHNCYINFGINNENGAEIDEDLLKDVGFNIEQLKKLNLSYQNYEISRLWFELNERQTGNHNSLSYIESSTSFYFDKDDNSWDEVSEEFKDFLDEEDDLGECFIHKNNSSTIVKGFGLDKTEKSGLVYRSGMALKFFADYVCDYLGEKRIVRNY